MFKCTYCGATTKHDHDGNVCHSCHIGAMRLVQDGSEEDND